MVPGKSVIISKSDVELHFIDLRDLDGIFQQNEKMSFPDFATLKMNYHELDSEGNPYPVSNDKEVQHQQCAARLFECLIKSQVDVSGYPYKKTTEGYAKGAKILGNWLRDNFNIKPVYLTSESFKVSKYANQTGILLNFNSQIKSQSGHIDLYEPSMKKDPMGGKNQFYGWPGYEVWFWPIK